MNRQILPSSVLMRLRCHQPSELMSSHCRSGAHWPDNQPLLQGPSWGDQQRTSGPTKFELLHTKIILMENKVQLKNKREHVVGWLLLSPVLLTPPPPFILLARRTKSILHDLISRLSCTSSCSSDNVKFWCSSVCS
jgi:hypothetical protein